mmetsp:Transcript_4531/g.14710  ORF Transcript_4531/g.14710 Transcript_4531/m.14710 type:complete len:273 (+) Transcript_4531:93-911(+)
MRWLRMSLRMHIASPRSRSIRPAPAPASGWRMSKKSGRKSEAFDSGSCGSCSSCEMTMATRSACGSRFPASNSSKALSICLSCSSLSCSACTSGLASDMSFASAEEMRSSMVSSSCCRAGCGARSVSNCCHSVKATIARTMSHTSSLASISICRMPWRWWNAVSVVDGRRNCCARSAPLPPEWTSMCVTASIGTSSACSKSTATMERQRRTIPWPMTTTGSSGKTWRSMKSSRLSCAVDRRKLGGISGSRPVSRYARPSRCCSSGRNASTEW